MKVLRTAPSLSYDMLKDINFLRPAAEIVRSCRENWDGSGYPRGLTGDQIPRAARTLAVVLVWDEVSAVCPGRPLMMPPQAFEYMREQSNKTLDPKIAAEPVRRWVEQVGNS